LEIYLPKKENWFALNDRVHQALNLPSDLSVRVYRGIHHAAFEIVQGTSTFFAHKRTAGWLKGQTYAFSTALPYCYKEGFQIQQLSQKNPDTNVKAWVDSLKKETSFVMMNEDHPVTGELFDNDELDLLLNDKKVFSFRASHKKHWLRGFQEVRPSSVLICEAGEDLAFAILGAKFKSPVQISSHFVFDENRVLQRLQTFQDSAVEDSSLLKKFESNLPRGVEIFLPANKTDKFCLQDRSLILHLEVNGEALARELGLGQDVIPLTNCAQGFADWDWWEDRPTPEQLRGLVVISLAGVKKLAESKLLDQALLRCQI
jgi:hypothetical protein